MCYFGLVSYFVKLAAIKLAALKKVQWKEVAFMAIIVTAITIMTKLKVRVLLQQEVWLFGVQFTKLIKNFHDHMCTIIILLYVWLLTLKILIVLQVQERATNFINFIYLVNNPNYPWNLSYNFGRVIKKLVFFIIELIYNQTVILKDSVDT